MRAGYKKAALLLTGVLAAAVLAGCGSGTEEEETTAEEMQDYADAVSSSDTPEEFPAFTATDLYGNTVTEDVFAQADITVVNIWATFCSPCIEEMPELAEWNAEMPDNVQIIGIVADVESESDSQTIADAVSIADEAGAVYTSLVPCDDLANLLHSIPGYPTTYFVDNDGDIVDEPFYGANVSSYQYIVEQFLAGAYDDEGNLIGDE